MAVTVRNPPKKSHLALADRIIKQGPISGPLPGPEEIATLADDFLSIILPGTRRTRMMGETSRKATRDRLAEVLADLDLRLEEAVFLGVHRACAGAIKEKDACWKRAQQITARTLAALPDLRALLAKDIQAAYEGDPAATGTDEVVACYPGLYAIAVYRAANRLLREGAPLVPRMMTEHAHARTGIDIHPGATIGSPFFIDHGTGIVIGETTRIGRSVRIYQGVTLGALSIKRKQGQPAPGAKHVPQRHPTIEDDVVIYANATILGGDTVIGKGAVVGANAWISYSVPPGRRVGGGA